MIPQDSRDGYCLSDLYESLALLSKDTRDIANLYLELLMSDDYEPDLPGRFLVRAKNYLLYEVEKVGSQLVHLK